VAAKHAERLGVAIEAFPGARLHVRSIIRDGTHAFVGSQSLAKLELDERREIGVLIKDKSVVQEMRAVFERDWSITPTGKRQARELIRTKGKKGEEQILAATGV